MTNDSATEMRFRRLENDCVGAYEAVDALRTETRKRFDLIDARFEQVDARFEQVDARFDRIEATLGEVLRRLPARP